MMTVNSKIALIIPVYNNAAITAICLSSILKSTVENPAFDIVCIDDGSDQETKDTLAKFPITVLTHDTNLGYVAATNHGIEYAQKTLNSDYIVLMNNDLIVSGKWLATLQQYCKEYDLTGFQGRHKLKGKAHIETHYLEFSCTMIKREVLDDIGILDPALTSGYYTDDDLCLRSTLAGYKIGLINMSKQDSVMHFHGQTFEQKFDKLQAIVPLFKQKWQSQLDNPIVAHYFNKHLLDIQQSWIPKWLFCLEQSLTSKIAAHKMKKYSLEYLS